jgi:hypothetical protein
MMDESGDGVRAGRGCSHGRSASRLETIGTPTLRSDSRPHRSALLGPGRELAHWPGVVAYVAAHASGERLSHANP